MAEPDDIDREKFTRDKNFVVIALLVLGLAIAVYFAWREFTTEDNVFNVVAPYLF